MTKEWEKPEDLRRRKPVLWLTMTALFMAMVVVLSMSALSIPVPGGHLYFNDVVIDTAAMLMDPLSAFIACGVGAFLGDLLFYPAPMFVSLITHGLQALVISLLCRKLRMKQPLFNDAEKSPDGRQIRRKMCYNSILERDTLSPEAETRCKETLREIVR